jgi:hypothetical protein
MSMKTQLGHTLGWALRLLSALAVSGVLSAMFAVRASAQEEFDQYKLRLLGYWFYSTPTGTVQGHADSEPISFQRDLGFSNYSTGSGEVDWKFTHKNHLFLTITPLFTSQQFTLNRTITFQGQTFDVGA